jgi:uncharacterized protein (DUF1330 family)
MAAYIIAEVEVTNSEVFEQYRSQVSGTIEQYGGAYLVRGGAVERAEGDWNPKRLVILRFESMARAKEWYDSEEYRGPKALRHQSANTNLILVEGV